MSDNFEKFTCFSCGEKFPGYEGVSLQDDGESNFYCNSCYNQEISEMYGFDFTDISFHPVTFSDSEGIKHTFHISTRIFGPHVTLEAYELIDDSPGGYSFSVMGDVEDDLIGLFTKLIDRVQRQVSMKHIEISDSYGYTINDNDTVRGYITDDPEIDLFPCVVIDGKEISWEEFGRMIMVYNGFNFKMEIFDKTEER
ncbi:DUF7713 domain-containing protein [Desulfonatronovibrio magnus]|uniref:DUF7713 domain-containing protein n=1 Tax=Desulfonatronovibrio magnus TaxID=698827 RepID=UPI000698C6D7|nr:hypothetical protein [Desulfonatronovibrio magnus]